MVFMESWGAEGDGRGMDGWMDGGEAKVYLVILIFWVEGVR
jgi:hypothetical protein